MSGTVANAAILGPQADLKERIRDFWDNTPCGTQDVKAKRYTREYFEEIEAIRYGHEPYIFSFAQFARWRGVKMLEVGVGAGTDFLQWVRAGADAHGIDLSPVSVEHCERRLPMYGLRCADLSVADAENLPFPDNEFEMVYSWGVIHHTPHTAKALSEIVRVTKPGGKCKIMVHHKASPVSLYLWLKWALATGHPWRSVNWCYANCVESPGTQAFTRGEVRRMLRGQPIEGLSFDTYLTRQDRILGHGKFLELVGRIVCLITGHRAGFYLTVEFTKQAADGRREN